jgi:hypothetical protein
MGRNLAKSPAGESDRASTQKRRERLAAFKASMRRRLPPPAYRCFVRASRAAAGWWYRYDFNQLAMIFGADKWSSHWYTQHYQRYFWPLRRRMLNVLEIGVGGYDDSAAGAESLRMWKAFFRKSRIVGIDVEDKTRFREHRIDIRQCDQTDSEALTRLCDEYGGFDIVIDDGSHINEHVIKSFQVLFPRLRPNGIYAVEDLQTAYWASWGGGLNSTKSSMAFFKKLADGLNHRECPIENYQPNYYDQKIVEIAFFHNLVVICKGENDEKENDPASIRGEIEAARSHQELPQSEMLDQGF